MRNRRSKEVVINQPGKGLLTNLPPDLQDNKAGQFIVSAKNVRAEDGQLKSAPGYERIHLDPSNLDSPANLVHQANLTSDDIEQRKTPIVGTEGRLYSVTKRSRPLVCPYGCSVTFAALGDSGKVGDNAAGVAELIRSWDPDLVLHAGDLVYADGNEIADSDEDNYESQVARYYSWAFGKYGGVFTPGDKQRFYPVMGNHDYDDGPESKYLDFFDLPGNEKYYDIKRGPVHFFFIDTYGDGPASTGPNGDPIDGTGAGSGVGQSDLSSTSPMAIWLRDKIQQTDCPIRVVVMHHPPETSESNYYPGYAVLQWPFGDWGVDLIITGHSHIYERINRTDGAIQVTVGVGGHSLRSWVGSPVDGSQIQLAVYGAFKGVATGNSLACQFISSDGAIGDTFTIAPNRGLSVCYTGDNAHQAISLSIRPVTATLSVGQTYPFQAYVTYADGSVELVTDKADWKSSDSGVVAMADNKGTAVAIGSSKVQVVYEGLSAEASVTVEASCADQPMDLVVVFDRSDSMNTRGSGGRTRIERAKEGLQLMFDQLDPTAGDRVAFLHFGGIHKTQTPDVVKLSDLTTDYAKVEGLAMEMRAYGATGIADALDEATIIFNEQHKAGHRKVLLLFTDGYANILEGGTLPDDTGSNFGAIRTAAMAAVTSRMTTFKANDDTLVIVVGLDVEGDATHYATVQSWATTGFYYNAGDTEQLVTVFSTVLHSLCKAVTSGDGLSIGLDNV